MNQEQLKPFTPVNGIMIYERGNTYYLQIHNILNDGGKFIWSEGKPLLQEDLNAIAQSIKKENMNTIKLKGVLPDNVLFYQPDIAGSKFIWYLPPMKRTLRFTAGHPCKSGEYAVPGLVLVVHGKTLAIYAYKGSDKPGMKTEIFHAPFYNIYETGKVCMGTTSNTRPKSYLHEEIERHEARFFASEFTTAHGDDSLLNPKFKLKMKQLYQMMSKVKQFPEAALKAHKDKTLGKFLETFERRAKHDF